jgi:hypothetical protein
MNNLKNYIILGLVVVLAIVLLVLIPKRDQPTGGNGNGNDNGNGTGQQPGAEVTDFLTCAEAGYPVMESHPRKCSANGVTYTEDISENPDVIVNIRNGDTVKSPLMVTGKARGNWFFEANLPVTLKDSNGKVLAQKGAQATGDWMTTDYVNFTVTLDFPTPTTEFGLLLIEKDNPSGLPQNDSAYAVPVRFK